MAKLLVSSSSCCNCFCRRTTQTSTSYTTFLTTKKFVGVWRGEVSSNSFTSSSRRSMMHPRNRGAALNNNSNNDTYSNNNNNDNCFTGEPHMSIFVQNWNNDVMKLYPFLDLIYFCLA